MPFFPRDPSITQKDLDRKYQALFEERGRDPSAWAAHAFSLGDGARLFWSYVDTAHDPETKAERYGFMLMAMMLAGLAIEVLAKALIVRETPQLVVGGELKLRGAVSHDLIALIARAKLPVTPVERAVLSELSGFVRFAGRYPIPTKAEHFTPRLRPTRKGKRPEIEMPAGSLISQNARSVFEAVFTRLSERLAATS